MQKYLRKQLGMNESLFGNAAGKASQCFPRPYTLTCIHMLFARGGVLSALLLRKSLSNPCNVLKMFADEVEARAKSLNRCQTLQGLYLFKESGYVTWPTIESVFLHHL